MKSLLASIIVLVAFTGLSTTTPQDALLKNLGRVQAAAQVDKSRQAFLFVSANIEENLTLDEASRRLRSEQQKRFVRVAIDIVGQTGSHGTKADDALGDWSDGVENSILVTIPYAVGADSVRYSAAQFGLLAKQKCVLTFVAAAGGADAVYELNVPERELTKLRKILDRHDIKFRTIVPGRQGHRVVIFDEGRKSRSNIDRLAAFYGITVDMAIGTGEFLGEESRDDAAKKFRQLIRDYEANPINTKYQPTTTSERVTYFRAPLVVSGMAA